MDVAQVLVAAPGVGGGRRAPGDGHRGTGQSRNPAAQRPRQGLASNSGVGVGAGSDAGDVVDTGVGAAVKGGAEAGAGARREVEAGVGAGVGRWSGGREGANVYAGSAVLFMVVVTLHVVVVKLLVSAVLLEVSVVPGGAGLGVCVGGGAVAMQECPRVCCDVWRWSKCMVRAGSGVDARLAASELVCCGCCISELFCGCISSSHGVGAGWVFTGILKSEFRAYCRRCGMWTYSKTV